MFVGKNRLALQRGCRTVRLSNHGLSGLTVIYCAAQASLPVAFDLVTKTERCVDAKTGKDKRRSQITKNARHRMLLLVCAHNQLRFVYVLNDVWYAASENMMFVAQTLKKHFVMPLKENRKVALSLADKQQGQYQAVGQLDLPAGTTRQVWLEAVDFPVLLVKQVFTNEDGSTGVLYLVSSDLTLSTPEVHIKGSCFCLGEAGSLPLAL